VDYAERQKHYAKIEKDRKTKVLTFVWAKTKRERGPEPAPFLVTAPAAGDGSPAAAGYASGICAYASSLPRSIVERQRSPRPAWFPPR
jgi:hypothetical protein